MERRKERGKEKRKRLIDEKWEREGGREKEAGQQEEKYYACILRCRRLLYDNDREDWFQFRAGFHTSASKGESPYGP